MAGTIVMAGSWSQLEGVHLVAFTCGNCARYGRCVAIAYAKWLMVTVPVKPSAGVKIASTIGVGS